MEAEAHRELMTAAIATETVAHTAATAGDAAAARAAFREAAATYRASWELASPTSFGRLVGMLKAAILAGDGIDDARYVEAALAGGEARSPTAAYAQAVAALALADDGRAAEWAELMRSASPAFVRTATAITALASADADAYRTAVVEIVDDFAGRDAHLTGVPIADTALMLEVLAGPRRLCVDLDGPLLPRLLPSTDFPRPTPDET
ncbi:MAG TPA: hypothetical protein VHW26_05775 [Solirubrobacteraceae bacterium]|jgi:hypothetical protein|nr:hypothetical protein [Solirubrobacteraceae bacterium]